MFNFKRLLIILKTNWKNVINETLPKGNKSELTDTNCKDMYTGVILIAISSCIYFFCKVEFVSILISVVRLLICEELLITINKNRNASINAIHIFILFVIASLNMLGSFIASIIYLTMSFSSFTNNMILMVLNITETIGFAFLVATFIEFLGIARKEYDADHYIEKKEEIKLRTININDISMHAMMKCDNCNWEITESDLFCPNCGKKLK